MLQNLMYIPGFRTEGLTEEDLINVVTQYVLSDTTAVA